MKKDIQLDKYDSNMINLFKRCENLTLDKIKDVWAKRCGLDSDYPELLHAINQHFLDLAYNLGLFDNHYTFQQFIFSLQPNHNWKFGAGFRAYLEKGTTDYELILLSRLDSLFRNTEVVKLPNYKPE